MVGRPKGAPHARVTKFGCNSVVECQLPKLNVAGSSPVIRLTKNKNLSSMLRKPHNID